MHAIFWFRRDLRLQDNAGLYHALKSGDPVIPVFIFDRDILDQLSDRTDARVTFIFDAIEDLRQQLEALGSTLLVEYGRPIEVFAKLLSEYSIGHVFTNRDYEPYALDRDEQVASLLKENGVSFQDYKDHVIFDGDEVVKADGTPYTVFTPYSRKWKARLETDLRAGGEGPLSYFFKGYPTEKYFGNFAQMEPIPGPTLENMEFTRSEIDIPGKEVNQKLIREYQSKRNFPAVRGTSRLGIHFRFGTISVREKARKAQKLSETFLNELIWRDFYSQILSHFPHVAKHPFRRKYDHVQWRNNEEEFKRWCEGMTGYPIVDAGMRELNATGFMHNRVRMITASFLTKHLLIDWRWGEAYFAEKLLDFDLASNNGGWQWAAGTGTDAAPYFRIFNPYSQQSKFDKDMKYIRKWVPEYGTPDYPEPVVEHSFARERCLEAYKAGLARADQDA